jgi:hypothetical protein
MQQRPFRVGDRVSVYGFFTAEDKFQRGRVICVNRKSRINHPIIVLIDTGSTEVTESFKEDGTRGVQTPAICFIKLGWENEKKGSQDSSENN